MTPLNAHERELWVSLREYFEALWVEREKRLNDRWIGQEEALRKALVQMESRLGLLNELRQGVITRDEFQAKHDALSEQIDKLTLAMSNLGGRTQGQLDARTVVYGVLVLLLTVAIIISPHIK